MRWLLSILILVVACGGKPPPPGITDGVIVKRNLCDVEKSYLRIIFEGDHRASGYYVPRCRFTSDLDYQGRPL